jgi:hypothetical protein
LALFRYPSRLRAGRSRTSFVSSSLCFDPPIVPVPFQSFCTDHLRRPSCLFHCTCTSLAFRLILIRPFVLVFPLLDASKPLLHLPTRLVTCPPHPDRSPAPFIRSLHPFFAFSSSASNPLGSFELLTPTILLRISNILPTHRRATSIALHCCNRPSLRSSFCPSSFPSLLFLLPSRREFAGTRMLGPSLSFF